MQVNRNSHTTSTKCQYQAAASKPKCCFGVKSPLLARTRQTIRKIVPTSTWKPWKPVAMKKVAPEQSRIKVLSSGKPNGSSTSMPLGGHCPPTASTAEGNRAASKKAQNQARKNITSEAMNRIIPY